MDDPLFSKDLDKLLPPTTRLNERDPFGAPASPARNPDAAIEPSVAWLRRWWQFGLIGGFALSYATAIKLFRAIRGGTDPDVDWGELPGFAATLFGMGFLCGVIVWAGRGLYRRIGLAGDAIVGLVVMVVFFISCAVVFEPSWLGDKFSTGGAPMFGFAAVLGLILGPWIGRDLRKEASQRRKR